MRTTRRSGQRTIVAVIAIAAVGFVAMDWCAARVVGYVERAGCPDGILADGADTHFHRDDGIHSGRQLLAVHQLSEAASNRHLAVADRLFEELNSPENIEARRWIFHNLPHDPGRRQSHPDS